MAATYRDATFISSDSHVTEPVELYATRVDRSLRERAPHIKDVEGWRTLYIEGLKPRKLMTAGQLAEATTGDWDPDVRIRDQERDGVTGRGDLPDLRPAGVLHLRGPEAPAGAVPGLQRLGGRGLRAHRPPARRWPRCRCSTSTTGSPKPSGRRRSGSGRSSSRRGSRQRPYNDAAYDRFWAVAQDLGLPLTFHSGTGHEPRVVRGPGGAVINYLLGAQLDGPMVLLDAGRRRRPRPLPRPSGRDRGDRGGLARRGS